MYMFLEGMLLYLYAPPPTSASPLSVFLAASLIPNILFFLPLKSLVLETFTSVDFGQRKPVFVE